MKWASKRADVASLAGSAFSGKNREKDSFLKRRGDGRTFAKIWMQAQEKFASPAMERMEMGRG
jgi:hypothetical protein